MSTITDRIIDRALSEWNFFGKQEYGADGTKIRDGMDETDDGFWQRVGIYWKEGTGKNLTGKNADFPWSATFISFLMRQAEAGERFRYSAQHSVYIRTAIKARQKSDVRYGFWGFRIAERAPDIGDLVCYSRQAGIGFDTPSANYKSHADVVVEKKPGLIKVIGGNVGNSVSMKSLRTDANGRLADRNHKWFAVLKNRLDE